MTRNREWICWLVAIGALIVLVAAATRIEKKLENGVWSRSFEVVAYTNKSYDIGSALSVEPVSEVVASTNKAYDIGSASSMGRMEYVHFALEQIGASNFVWYVMAERGEVKAMLVMSNDTAHVMVGKIAVRILEQGAGSGEQGELWKIPKSR